MSGLRCGKCTGTFRRWALCSGSCWAWADRAARVPWGCVTRAATQRARGWGDRSPSEPWTSWPMSVTKSKPTGAEPPSQHKFFHPLPLRICEDFFRPVGSSPMMNLPLLLAIACTLETGLGERPEVLEQRECQLLWSVHGETALTVNGRLDLVVLRYVSGFRCEGKKCDTQRFKTIRSMNVRGEEPTNWDIHAGPWEKYRALWLRRLRAAREFTTAFMYGLVLWPESNSRCRMARHYGGRCAAHGACDHVPACWELARCGDTSSAFWIPKTCPLGSSDTIDARLASARR
jgi:hypothetical protein